MEIQKDIAAFLMGSSDVGLSFISAVEHFAIHNKRSSENQNLVFRRPLF
ncbi:nitrogen fixation protein NifZ [Neisseria sicca]